MSVRLFAWQNVWHEVGVDSPYLGPSFHFLVPLLLICIGPLIGIFSAQIGVFYKTSRDIVLITWIKFKHPCYY